MVVVAMSTALGWSSIKFGERASLKPSRIAKVLEGGVDVVLGDESGAVF